MSNGSNGRAENRRVRNEYHPDSTTPVGHLDTTIDRSSRINLFAAIFVVFSVAAVAVSITWTARGFIESMNSNTASIDQMTEMMEEALERIERNTQFSAENRGMIKGLEGEFERMNRRIIRGDENTREDNRAYRRGQENAQ